MSNHNPGHVGEVVVDRILDDPFAAREATP
jgi:hypothetical protein